MTAGGDLPSELAGVSALAVVAHPDDESFGLGAVLAAMAAAGSAVRVLCFTRGEASALGGSELLAAVRQAELADAAVRLGLLGVHLDDFPDGGLAAVDPQILDSIVEAHLGDATVLVVFEPGGVTGHPDHRAATAAAARAAARHGLTIAEWGVSATVAGALRQELGVPFSSLDGGDVREFAVDRRSQEAAIAAHASQATGNAVLARRLELQQGRERLRIRRPGGITSAS